MKNTFVILPIILLCTLLFSPATIVAAPIQTDISAAYTYDDNVTRAELDHDIEKDSIVSLEATARYKIPLNEISYFSLKATLAFNHYLDFSKLSNTRLGLHGGYHFRPFGGYTASRFFALASYEQRMFDSDQRNGSALQLQFGWNKRLTDVLTLSAGFIRESVDADETIGVFDADNNRLYLEADFKTGNKNTVYTRLSLFDGDIVSTTAPNADIISAAAPFIVRDDAFLDLTPERFAYKLDATTTTLKVGNVYSLSSSQALDASLFYYKSKADLGINYSGLIVNISYLHRF